MDDIDRWLNLLDATAEAILDMTDEEVRELLKEAGGDPDTEAEHVRRLIADSLRRHSQ